MVNTVTDLSSGRRSKEIPWKSSNLIQNEQQWIKSFFPSVFEWMIYRCEMLTLSTSDVILAEMVQQNGVRSRNQGILYSIQTDYSTVSNISEEWGSSWDIQCSFSYESFDVQCFTKNAFFVCQDKDRCQVDLVS